MLRVSVSLFDGVFIPKKYYPSFSGGLELLDTNTHYSKSGFT